jgi:hypothetical protein
MLTQRLRERCPSAKVFGLGMAKGYSLAFSKPSIDSSGKATLALDDSENTHGLVFEIARDELCELDNAEGIGYERNTNFIVYDLNGKKLTICLSRKRRKSKPEAL